MKFALTFILFCCLLVRSEAFGPTFGTGLAGVPICPKATTILSHTLKTSETHGVLHHFWTTGAQYKIDRMWVEYYIDGEETPSISFQPSMMCGLGFPTEVSHDFEYSAGGLCGKTAPVGGWHNIFPIPFYKSVNVTVRSDPSDGSSCFNGYLNVRGTVELPLVVPGSGIPLPLGSRLILQSNPLALRQPLEYVVLASLPSGQGVIFETSCPSP